MPTESAAHPAPAAAAATPADPAATRILRLAVGTAIALAFSQAVNWGGSFIAPVLTAFILALPIPAPTLRGGFLFVLALMLSLVAGLALLPFIHYMAAAGVLLVALALFGAFYYSAAGGSPIVGAFLAMGLTMIPAIGSETVDGAIVLTVGLSFSAIVAVAFVWVAYAIFPEPRRGSPAGARKKPAPPPRVEARRNALRSTIIVMPVILWFLMVSNTASYAAVLIKVATMGQQAEADQSRQAGRSLMLSTLIGGAAAVVAWGVLRIWPSLIMYTLLMLLAGLVVGPRVFSGPGLARSGPMWSYAFVTMMVVLGPAVMDGASGDDAGGRFVVRIMMFLAATLYSVIAVTVFDRFWPRKMTVPV